MSGAMQQRRQEFSHNNRFRPFQNALERPHHGEFITRNHLSPGNLTREHHNTLLEYLSKFMNAYPNEKKFSWIWASHLGHDSMNGFSHADNDFYNFLVKHREKVGEIFSGFKLNM